MPSRRRLARARWWTTGIERHRRQHLGGDEGLVPPAGDGLADGPLGAAEAVDLGGVDQVDAQVQGPLGDAQRFAFGEGPAVAPLERAELPGPEADHREPDATHLDVTHAEKLSEPGPGAAPCATMARGRAVGRDTGLPPGSSISMA